MQPTPSHDFPKLFPSKYEQRIFPVLITCLSHPRRPHNEKCASHNTHYAGDIYFHDSQCIFLHKSYEQVSETTKLRSLLDSVRLRGERVELLVRMRRLVWHRHVGENARGVAAGIQWRQVMPHPQGEENVPSHRMLKARAGQHLRSARYPWELGFSNFIHFFWFTLNLHSKTFDNAETAMLLPGKYARQKLLNKEEKYDVRFNLRSFKSKEEKSKEKTQWVAAICWLW